MIGNATNISLSNITHIGNNSSLPEFLVKANTIIYDGWFWFAILWVVWVISFVAAQKLRDKPLPNAMYAMAFVTVLALLSRGVTAVVSGSAAALISDHQLWVFPILTIVMAVILYG